MKWFGYDAFEEVVEIPDVNVLSSRWVITEKNGKVKARLCLCSFEEEIHPQSGSSRASKDSFKFF